MKKVLFFAVAAIALAACSKTYEVKSTQGSEIGFGTWNEMLTKAGKTDFDNGESFAVWGVKTRDSGDPTSVAVFNGVQVTKASSGWGYEPKRYWDPAYTNYTFHAVWPHDAVASGDYAGNGLFVSNSLLYDGTSEKLLVAEVETVASGNGGSPVTLTFRHAGALIDFKFKKHADLQTADVNVTAFSLAGIQTTGTFTVDSYSSNVPVGATVSTVAGLGWELPAADSRTTNANATPYINNAGVTLAATSGEDLAGTNTATAASLISELVVMPQVLDDSQTFTIAYTITDANNQVSTYTPAAISLKQFDNTSDPGHTEANYISAWMPGVHYTYYITINANAIQFNASIEPWTTSVQNGYHYLVN